MKDLDINQVPSSSVGGDHDHDNQDEWMEEEEEMMSSSINGTTHSGPPRKKLRLSKEQSRLLEESFRQHHTLNPVSLARDLFFIFIFIFSILMVLIKLN